MTRMTTDVDALSTFFQTGLTTAIVSMLSFVGVLIAILVLDGQLSGHRCAAADLGRRDCDVPRRSCVAYTRLARRSAQSTPTSRKMSPGCGSRKRIGGRGETGTGSPIA